MDTISVRLFKSFNSAIFLYRIRNSHWAELFLANFIFHSNITQNGLQWVCVFQYPLDTIDCYYFAQWIRYIWISNATRWVVMSMITLVVVVRLQPTLSPHTNCTCVCVCHRSITQVFLSLFAQIARLPSPTSPQVSFVYVFCCWC